MTISTIKLSDGYAIPQIGLGLWQVKEEADFHNAFQAAFKAGYRLFDTAQMYGNEQLLGSSIAKTKIDRQKLFITTKINVNNFGSRKTLASSQESLNKLGLEYIDLMLLHFPVPVLRKNSWLSLEKLKKQGLIRSIGVSNYTIRHLEEMKKYASEMPVVNQVELHVFLQQPELLEYCREHKIVVEAYSPLAHGQEMDNPIIKAIATKHSKSYAQVMLRYLIELGLVVIPKSISSDRIKENIALFDFKLDKSDLNELKGLDKNLRTCWNPSRVP